MLKYNYNREKLGNKSIYYLIHLNDKNLKFADFHITLYIQKIYKNLTIYINVGFISFFVKSSSYGY